MPLTAAELHGIRRLYDKYDKNGSGDIDYDEFHDFIRTALKFDLASYKIEDGIPEELPQMEINEDDVLWLFNGIDIDNNKRADFSEVIKCFAAIKDHDMQYLSMMSYRALDTDRDREVKVKDIKDNAGIYGEKLTREQFLKKIEENLEPGIKILTYAQYFQALTGIKIDSEFDPYEGLVHQSLKSALCNLI